MSILTHVVEGETAMLAWGGHLAQAIKQFPCLIYLKGELGMGKSTLVRGALKALGFTGAVKSPTYTLLEPYALGERHVAHFDLYRLNNPEELVNLGWRDELDQAHIAFIEWPERGQGVLPSADLTCYIQPTEGEARQLAWQPESPLGQAVIEGLAKCV